MICVAVLAFALVSQTPRVTIGSLLHEMVDRDAVAKLPDPAFKLLQASSYDRAETDPKDAKTWFANGDAGQFIRTEKRDGKTEWVILEHDGPGAITRLWTPLQGEKDDMTMFFYFDGAAEPSMSCKFNDLIRGKLFVKPPFAFIAWHDGSIQSGCGGDFYFPIPFAKSCKVTLDQVPGYYAFNYRTYAPGTEVETFTQAAFDAAKAQADAAAEALNTFAVERHSRVVQDGGTLKPKQEMKLELTKGPMAVYEITVEVPKDVDPQALRSVVIEGTFDGEQTIWCPIGDFFGSGVRLRPVRDWYRNVTADGKLTCNWVMPYRNKANLRLLNFGPRKLSLKFKAESKRWDWNDRSTYFHATWRHQYPIATRPMSDWNYVETTGQGMYVGDTLTVMSPAAIWYGEGDEKVYVDGEAFPSHLGTGTEDYYGYGWGMAERFSSPFIAMPKRDHDGRSDWSGYTTTSRVRLLDQIPFERSLKFDMEIWHWAACQVEYSAATFWYGRPGATSNRPPAPEEAAKPLPEWRTYIKDALECETMEVLSKPAGAVLEIQDGGVEEGSWSASRQLFAQFKNVGEALELRIPVKRAGKQRVTLYGTKSYDYGIVRFSIDGKLAKEVDLWNARPVASGPIDLGVFDLKSGGAVLLAEVVGTNPKSTGPRYYFGLDCVVLGK